MLIYVNSCELSKKSSSSNLIRTGYHLGQTIIFSFDDDRTGYIDHEQFVRRAAEDFNPGDNAGTSTNIVTNSQDTAANFNTGQMCRREDLLLNQINTLQCMSNDDLEKQFRYIHYARPISLPL